MTQLALGAAVGHLAIGRRGGRRAIVWGAVLGTLPDLDVFVGMGDALADFTYHRSWSHALLVLSLLSPPLGILLARTERRVGASAIAWTLATWLVFVTHVLLDACTVYGTQLLWPLASPPVSWGAIFVIDPLYTLPLLIGLVIAWRAAPESPRRARRANAWGFTLSCVYLGWTFWAQSHVTDRVVRQLAYSELLAAAPARVLVTPTPFQSLLWRVLVVDEQTYREAYVSLVADRGKPIEFRELPRFTGIESARLRDDNHVARLEWFSHGYWGAAVEADHLVVRDLRMGAEPDYFFRFVIAERTADGTWRRVAPRLANSAERRWDRLGWMFARIFDSDA